ncbi:MAG: hypothetical protein QOG20_2906 [Pseudonocardiales bacterium]|jgi:hypothetical protein|nr:hypothetical protein [Pseudonocardiales bacterium]
MGLLLYLLVAAAPTLLFWLALRLLPAVVERIDDWWARRHAPPPPRLESAVANLRRLRREVRGGAAPTQVRRLALYSAYDATLIQVCGIVGVDAPLGSASESDRAFARLLTEAELEEAGIALDPPSGGTAAA